MAKTGEQDKDGPSSLQGSEYMMYFILRADIIQPDYQISFKRRVNNVTICLWLKHRKVNMEGFQPRGRGVLPYITYTGMCRPTGSWFWRSWFRTGYPFQRRFAERGIIFWTHESSSFERSHLKLFKDRLLLKIRLNALTSKLLYSCCTLEQSIKYWPISRTRYQF